MVEFRALRVARWRAVPVAIWIAVLAALWFAALAMATPFDHDESQYVAGAHFAARLTIFRDFLYLQPPIHAWAYAPIAWGFPGHAVMAMRMATAMTALATLWLLWRGQRIAGVSRASAMMAVMLVSATAAFQFSASVVRNDMLPTMLTAMAMVAALMALRDGRGRLWLAAGLCLGLAIATKLSFAPVGIAAGLFLVASRRQGSVRAAGWVGTGAVVGMVPMLLAWWGAPDGFVHGVLTFGISAPHAWYAANGAAQDLSLAEKGADLIKYLAKGPALVALMLIIARCRRMVDAPGRRLALWMIGGAMIGAALPTPTQVQYLLPLVPPLTLALGFCLDDVRRVSERSRRIMLGLLVIASVPGMVEPARDMMAMLRGGSPVVAAARDARASGALVRAMAGDGMIATLSPHLMIDSGLAIDPRFAPGPFVYRTGQLLSPVEARSLHVMTPATLGDLDRAPPAAILTGYERGTRKLPLRPDDGLVGYARSRGYRAVPMRDGVGMLFVRQFGAGVALGDPPSNICKGDGQSPPICIDAPSHFQHFASP